MIKYNTLKIDGNEVVDKKILNIDSLIELNEFIRFLINGGYGSIIKNNNIHFFKLEDIEDLDRLNNKIKDCLNFNSGFYCKMIDDKIDIFLENRDDYTILDKDLKDEYGKYIIIIYRSVSIFGKREIKLYYELNYNISF